MVTKKSNKIRIHTTIVKDEKSEVENELRQRFLPNGKNIPNDQSIKAMQQFLRFTDSIVSRKNVAGGSFFTSNNRDKEENQEKYRVVYANVLLIREPLYKIKDILQNNNRLDFQQIERISYYLMDLVEAMPFAVNRMLDDPAIKDDQSNFMRNVGHNVGFRDFILKQFIKDIKRETYNKLIERIKAIISNGKDPLSYGFRY